MRTLLNVGAAVIGVTSLFSLAACSQDSPAEYVEGQTSNSERYEDRECDSSYTAYISTKDSSEARLKYPAIEDFLIEGLDKGRVLCDDTSVFVKFQSTDAAVNTEWYYGIKNLQVNSNGTCTFSKDGEVESADCLKTPLYGSELTSFLESEITEDVVGEWDGKIIPEFKGGDAYYYALAETERSGTYKSGSGLTVIDPDDSK